MDRLSEGRRCLFTCFHFLLQCLLLLPGRAPHPHPEEVSNSGNLACTFPGAVSIFICRPQKRTRSRLRLIENRAHKPRPVGIWATGTPTPDRAWCSRFLGLTSVCICRTWLGDTPLVWIGFPRFQIVGGRVIVFLIWFLKAINRVSRRGKETVTPIRPELPQSGRPSPN